MIAVLGGGAWGTALATVAAADGSDVLLWVRRAELAGAIRAAGENRDYLPGIPLPPSVRVTSDPRALEESSTWLVVPPAQHLRTTLEAVPLSHAPTLVLCSKGIETGTLLLMNEVAREVAPASAIAVLSGPSLAHEVAAGKPAAVTLAADDMALARALSERLARPAFRPYAADDIVGCEIGGAVKNVLAIASGVVLGAGLGENARAAVISRGFAEMARFGLARGARLDTLTGLSGLGDLVLTCSSRHSRNTRLGMAIGEGKTPAEALAGKRTVAEGAATAPVLVAAAERAGVDMPITMAVAGLLAGKTSVAEVVQHLLRRPLREERLR